MKKTVFTSLAALVLAAGMSFAQSSTASNPGSSSGNNSANSSDQAGSTSGNSNSSASSGTKHRRKASKSDQDTNATGGASSGKMTKADEMFMMKAAQGGEAEVELGKLAAQKAENDQVKQFAQKMVDDHSKANQELQSLAGQKGVTLPTDMDKKEQAEKDRLSSLSGAQFDKAYMQHMVVDHRKDVVEFQQKSKTAKDSDLKSWAEKTLPTLKDHLKQAQTTASAVGAAGKATATGKKRKANKSETSGQ